MTIMPACDRVIGWIAGTRDHRVVCRIHHHVTAGSRQAAATNEHSRIREKKPKRMVDRRDVQRILSKNCPGVRRRTPDFREMRSTCRAIEVWTSAIALLTTARQYLAIRKQSGVLILALVIHRWTRAVRLRREVEDRCLSEGRSARAAVAATDEHHFLLLRVIEHRRSFKVIKETVGKYS